MLQLLTAASGQQLGAPVAPRMHRVPPKADGPRCEQQADPGLGALTRWPCTRTSLQSDPTSTCSLNALASQTRCRRLSAPSRCGSRLAGFWLLAGRSTPFSARRTPRVVLPCRVLRAHWVDGSRHHCMPQLCSSWIVNASKSAASPHRETRGMCGSHRPCATDCSAARKPHRCSGRGSRG